MPVYDVSESAFSATTVGRETAMRPFGYSDVRSVSQSFSFRLDNADESTMPAFLAFQLSSSTDLLYQTSAVPEPSTLILLCMGLSLLGFARRHQQL